MKIELEDADGLEIVIKKTGQQPVTVTVDLLELRMVVEAVENRYELEEKDGMVLSTRPFLKELADEISDLIGVEDISISMAFALWSKLGTVLTDLKKNTDSEPPLATNTESTHSN